MLICLDQRTGAGCGCENRDGAQFCAQCGNPLRFALQLRNPGDVVNGRYRIVRVIGHGGFGAVYEAEDTGQPGLRVALKETFDPAEIQHYRAEFAVLSGLTHPHLPRYFEVFEANGNGYLVMEYVPGQSLEDIFVAQKGPLVESLVLSYAGQICEALTHLHTQKPAIIHRDIKPANIRLTPAGLIKLVDFGLVKQGTGATQASRRAVTPAYAPPEQWGGMGIHTEPRSDLYALGATLYHLLSGQEPTQGIDRLLATQAGAPDPLPPLRGRNAQVSQAVADAVAAAMAVRPDQRPNSAGDLRRLLQGTAKHSPPPIPAPAPAPKAPAPPPAGASAPAVPAAKVQAWKNVSTFEPLPYFTNLVQGAVKGLCFSPDGKLLAVQEAKGTITIWEPQQNRFVRQLRNAGGHSVREFSPDGALLMTTVAAKAPLLAGPGASYAAVAFWSVNSSALQLTLSGSWRTDAEALRVSFTRDGTLVLVKTGSGAAAEVGLWAVCDQTHWNRAYKAGTKVVELTCRDACVALDGSLLALLDEHEVHFLDMDNLQETSSLPVGSKPIVGMHFAADGRLVLLEEASVVNYAPATGTMTRNSTADGAMATLHAWSLDGELAVGPILDGYYGGTISVVCTKDGKSRSVSSSALSPSRCMALSPDASVLAVGSDNGVTLLKPR